VRVSVYWALNFILLLAIFEENRGKPTYNDIGLQHPTNLK